MQNSNNFTWKSNKFEERITNKKYLAKKKRYQEKNSEPKKEQKEVNFIESKKNESIWKIIEIKQDTSWKIFSCIHRWKTITLQIKNKDVSEEIVIWDNVIFHKWIIDGIISRTNLLSRYKWDSDRFSLYKRILHPIASNLDFVVIVGSAKNPKFQPGFIDRYMILAEACNIPVIICISKSDLETINDPILDFYKNYFHIPVIYTSSETGVWLDELKAQIQGKTIVFVGKSWVGKSSIVNKLFWNKITTTSSVSEKGGQWKHTTTSSKMYEWQQDSFIIDTPWIRSLDFLEFTKEELQIYFREFEDFSQKCKYRDCLHLHEPDCWVKNAVKETFIPQFRYNTYVRLLKEIL